jgi:NAD(P)-dependent dehydrogenase (short-subunit alcohol dehydrogenase family)
MMGRFLIILSVLEHDSDQLFVTGPVKAALESVTRAMAKELGPKRIRVNAM